MTELSLAEFNSVDADRIRGPLSACLAVPRWVEHVVAGRPYDTVSELVSSAGLVLRDDEIHTAMAAHPRIGEKPSDGMARTEQSGVDNDAAARFRAANQRYEEHFGHVFLVCASGRGGEELLANLHERLHNDPATELAVAGGELVEIAKRRLEKLVRP